MMVEIQKSPRSGKKLRAVFSDGVVVDFGAEGMSDFTIHKDEARRQRFLSRFAGRIAATKDDPQSPMTLSHLLLWNKPTLAASINDYKKKFGLH